MVKERDITSFAELYNVPAEAVMPTDERILSKMCLIASGTFAGANIAGAVLKGIKGKKVDGKKFTDTFFAELNVAGIGRFIFACAADSKYWGTDIRILLQRNSNNNDSTGSQQEDYIEEDSAFQSLLLDAIQERILYCLEAASVQYDIGHTTKAETAEKKSQWLDSWKHIIVKGIGATADLADKYFVENENLRFHRKEVQKMDQIKIGTYLKELRKEKNLTQEQIAEKFGVSQRSVSRWENGYTMPDISILIELADYYDVDLREILNGERKANNMDADLKETLVMVADYTSEEKKKLVTSLYSMIWTCIVAFGILILINVFHLTRESTTWDTTAIFCSAIGLIYAISCFVRVLQLTGKIDKKSHSKLIVASLILAGGLFVLTIVAVLYGCGIIG